MRSCLNMFIQAIEYAILKYQLANEPSLVVNGIYVVILYFYVYIWPIFVLFAQSNHTACLVLIYFLISCCWLLIFNTKVVPVHK